MDLIIFRQVIKMKKRLDKQQDSDVSQEDVFYKEEHIADIVQEMEKEIIIPEHLEQEDVEEICDFVRLRKSFLHYQKHIGEIKMDQEEDFLDCVHKDAEMGEEYLLDIIHVQAPLL